MARPADPHARLSLVKAALGEFVKSGIQKARIEDITAACGLSKGAFYLHFGSKEALFGEVVGVLQTEFDALRVSRERAYAELIGRGVPARRRERFVAELAEIDFREDRKLLELLWEWRQVTAVLLHGSAGTQFDGVMWAMLDREAARVDVECRALKDARLIRSDVPGDVLGLMIVGTYLLVARKLATLEQKPDFDHWVRALQTLIAEGTTTDVLRAERTAQRRVRPASSSAAPSSAPRVRGARRRDPP